MTDSEVANRFVHIYYALAMAVKGALFGAQPADGMGVMDREERNLRRAMALASGCAEFDMGAGIGDTIGLYLERVGRMRDHTRLASWMHEHMGGAVETEILAMGIDEHVGEGPDDLLVSVGEGDVVRRPIILGHLSRAVLRCR